MKKILCFLPLALCMIFSACGNANSIAVIGGADGPTQIYVAKEGKTTMYQQIRPEEAKALMETVADVIILDVREQEEFDEGHIPGAILLPYEQIKEKAAEILPDKDRLILVYCRSGRRSKIAAQSLSDLGYRNIQEFGGIIDWPYEITK